MSRLPRRAAALALLAGLLVAAYVVCIRPIVELHRSLEARAAMAQAQLVRDRARAAEAGGLRRALAAQDERAPAEERYLSGRTPALAAAQLQGLVKRAVDAGEGDLLSVQVLGTPHGPSGEVAVRARVRGDVRTLQRILHRLEAGAPVLFIDNLFVEVGSPEVPAAKGRPLRLALSFDAIGRSREGPSLARLAADAGPAGWPLAPLERYAAILERPLFEPTRRMPGAGAAASVGASAPPDAAVRLAGVLIDARHQVALLQESGSTALVRVRPGESHDGWTLVEVGPAHALLRRGRELRRLGLGVP